MVVAVTLMASAWTVYSLLIEFLVPECQHLLGIEGGAPCGTIVWQSGGHEAAEQGNQLRFLFLFG